MRACVRVCVAVRACVCVCVRACVRVCVRVHLAVGCRLRVWALTTVLSHVVSDSAPPSTVPFRSPSYTSLCTHTAILDPPSSFYAPLACHCPAVASET